MRKAKARVRREPGVMNKTESAYGQYLQVRLVAGEIQAYSYEPISLRLAKRTYYKPDFLVITGDGTIEFHEVKGSWKAPHQDDAKVKIKVAAETYWWARFISAETVPKKLGGGWKFTEFSDSGDDVLSDEGLF